MYLKSIEIQGFKSFANKMKLDFHDGITGIVGPNGSGKSNIADAVRWVLGEQKVKQLRSSSMQDVIFAGTETRKPVSFAYVAITLDNSDHALPLDYSEVTVARRVYRSGESEYLMNGVQCRRRDIQELFYDTGIGKEGYSIIGQGQIDKILSGKPEDRRELFDEAAGIVKFKRRKAAAVKKLEDEHQNLLRIQDILTELEARVNPLKRQSEQARIYLQKKEELRKYEVNSFLLKNAGTEAQLKQADEDLKIAEDQMREAGAAFTKVSSEYDSLEKKIAEADESISSLTESRTRSEVSIEKYEGQINVLKEQINAIKQSEGQYKDRVQSLENDIAVHEQTGRDYALQCSEYDRQKQQILREKEDVLAQLLELEIKVSECESAVGDGKNELLGAVSARADLQAAAERCDALIEQSHLRRKELEGELVSKEDGTGGAALSKAEEELENFTANILEMEAKRADISKKREDHRLSYDELRLSLDDVREKYHRESSRLEYLTNIAERYDGYGNSIRRVMEQKRKVPGIIGVVADIIKTDRRYETAIETALGASIQNIVTDNEETAKKMIAFLKENRYGRATFLPLNAMKAPENVQARKALSCPGALGMANDLARTDPKYDSLCAQLLGRTLVADNIDSAIAIQRKFGRKLRIVTLEGELLMPGGSMSGGAFKNSSNLLGRTREIEALKKQILKLKENEEEIKNRIEDVQTAEELLKDDFDELQEQLQDAYIRQNSLRMETERLREESIRQEEEHAGILSRIEDISGRNAQTAARKDEILKQIEQSKDREKEIELYIAKNDEDLTRLSGELSGMRDTLGNITLAESQTEQKIAFADENIRRIAEETAKLRSDLQTLNDEYAGSEERIRDRQQEIKRLELYAASEKDSLQTISEDISECTAGRAKMASQQKGLLAKRDELAEEKNNIDREIYTLTAKKEKLESKMEEMIAYLWDEYSLAPHAAQELRDEQLASVSGLDKLIKSVKDEIKALGNVNVNAIEEYREVAERYELLSSQYEDIKKTNEAFEGVIRRLDDGMRSQFAEKFADIRREFDKAFKELFGGGKATLELIEGEDILDSGVGIIAQPPGKKLQNMMQLSGGEKALTAIALLFAIQNMKPSPFCLLDEIEAALDDSNVGRFAAYLHKLTKNTQFIIITHRRGTMNAADRLYGITMQEKGVSALVSVNLVEAQLEE